MSWYVFRRIAGGEPRFVAGPFEEQRVAELEAERRQQQRNYALTEHTTAKLKWPSEFKAWFDHVRDTAEV